MEEGGSAAMLHDLLAMDLGDWHPRDHVPKTEALRKQQALSLTPDQQWWLGLLQDGALPGASPEPTNPGLASGSKLYEHMRRTVPAFRFQSDHMLSQVLKKYGAHRDHDYRIDGLRAWQFPSLKEARAAWPVPMEWGQKVKEKEDEWTRLPF
jgi:hypothetical protein